MIIIDAWAQHPTPRHTQDPIFDSLRRWTRNDRGGELNRAPEMPLSATLQSMDEAGVALSLISAWVGPKGEMISNDEVAGFVKEAPDRLVGVGSVDISRPMDAVREIRRCVKQLGFKAIRVLPWLWELPPTDAWFYPVYAECCEVGIPFCTQVGHTGPLKPSEYGRPIGNRMFFQYMREAHFLVEEGAAVEAVDKALTDYGMAMGLLAVDDMAGIDVGVRVRQENAKHEAPGRRQPLVVDRLYELGRYGQKTGAGWYKYDDNRRAIPDPEVAALIEQTAKAAGIMRREIGAQEIVERSVYALINEGAKILAEGFTLRASDIDIVYLNGYGFPAWRGGPMWYADTVGVKKIYDRACEFHAEHGAWWEPAPLLKQLAETGGTFVAWDKAKGAKD